MTLGAGSLRCAVRQHHRISDKLGPLTFGDDEKEVFLGHSVARHKEISESTSGIIDQEVHEFIDRNYKRAEQILRDNLEKLHLMAQALIKYETIGLDQIQDIMAGRPVREVSSWRGDSSVEEQGTTVAPHLDPEDNGVIKRNDDDNGRLSSAHDE